VRLCKAEGQIQALRRDSNPSKAVKDIFPNPYPTGDSRLNQQFLLFSQLWIVKKGFSWLEVSENSTDKQRSSPCVALLGASTEIHADNA
jgi:hypothetical protein